VFDIASRAVVLVGACLLLGAGLGCATSDLSVAEDTAELLASADRDIAGERTELMAAGAEAEDQLELAAWLDATDKPADGSVGAAATIQGCPSGYVCIYPNAGWNGGHPSHLYFRYGCYNLNNMFGVHRIFNNQTGGAAIRTCLQFGCGGCEGFLLPGTFIDKNLTPINSIVLVP
jgi:hypothetical protein